MNLVLRTCTEHLERQRVLLEQLRDAVASMGRCLSGRDYDGLRQVLSRIEGLSEPARDLRNERKTIRNEISLSLGIPLEHATIGALIRAAPGQECIHLSRLREQLMQLALDVDRCNHCNALIVRNSIAFYDRIFRALAPVKPTGDRYAPSGKLRQPAHESLFQAKG